MCEAVVRETFGDERLYCDVPSNMTSEDFGFMLEERPGTYVPDWQCSCGKLCIIQNAISTTILFRPEYGIGLPWRSITLMLYSHVGGGRFAPSLKLTRSDSSSYDTRSMRRKFWL